MAKTKDRYAQHSFAKGWASVSQITGIPDKPFLYGWYWKNCKHSEKSAYIIVKESQIIGQLLDDGASRYFEDKDIPPLKVKVSSLSSEAKAYYHQSMNNFYIFVEAYKPVSVLGQQVVYDKGLRYIGTFDRLVKIEDKLVLIDWKATNFVGYSYKLQLEGYYRALTYMMKCGIIDVKGKWAKEQLMIVQLPKKEDIKLDKHVISFSADEDRFKNGFCGLLNYYYQEKKEK